MIQYFSTEEKTKEIHSLRTHKERLFVHEFVY